MKTRKRNPGSEQPISRTSPRSRFEGSLRSAVPAGQTTAKSRGKKSERFGIFIIGIVLAAGTLAIAAASIDWSSISASHLVYAGGAPRAPMFDVRAEKVNLFFHVTIRPIFKNAGFTSGRIERVNVVPVGLKRPPKEISVVYLDRSDIGWLETKEIRCEFLVTLDSRTIEPKTPLEFRIYFYGPNGNELYWEGVAIENIPARSA